MAQALTSSPDPQAPAFGDITAAAQTLDADVSKSATATLYVTGTFAGHNGTFEGSIDNGVSWFAVQAVRTNSNVVELTTGVLGAAPAYAWHLSVSGLTNIRVRATAHASGTATWRIRPSLSGSEPVPATQLSAGTQPVSGPLTDAQLRAAVVPVADSSSIAAGANAIGDVGLQARANATGAASKFHLVSAATTNANNVKASAGRLLGWRITNTNAAIRYVKLHNTAGAPTAGSGVVETIGVPASSSVTGYIGQGSGFATGIAITTVTGSADSDAVAVAAGDLIIDLYFA